MSDAKISVEELIQRLFNCPTGLHIEQLEQALWKARKPKEPVPKNFCASIYGILAFTRRNPSPSSKNEKLIRKICFFT